MRQGERREEEDCVLCESGKKKDILHDNPVYLE